MSLAEIAHRQRAKRLVPRLDECVKRAEVNSLVFQHGVVYAAFLTDFIKERLDLADPNVVSMLGMVSEFCDLLDHEFPTAN
jgi:hypothetical protein